MYVRLEYVTVVAVIALIASLLFVVMVVPVTIEEGIAAILRISRRELSTGTLARALERAR